jgi:hypothetical protein
MSSKSTKRKKSITTKNNCDINYGQHFKVHFSLIIELFGVFFFKVRRVRVDASNFQVIFLEFSNVFDL